MRAILTKITIAIKINKKATSCPNLLANLEVVDGKKVVVVEGIQVEDKQAGEHILKFGKN
jgi:sulfur carrier protein ThiS